MVTPPHRTLDGVWQYPLFEALYGRRTRRFSLGGAMNEGPFRYQSRHPPLPLSELEEAVLVAAGVGFSGIALWDQSRPLPYRSGDGRTFPSTNRGRRTALFFTNDDGVHVIDPVAGSANSLREVADPDAREKALSLYREHRRTLSARRLDIPRRVPPMCGHNLWASNAPGSTLFMPVCDVSHVLIGLIAQFVDPHLQRFAFPAGGMNIVDDRHGFRPAGTERWLKSGFLDERKVLPLSHVERQATYFMFSEPAAICQNIFLASEAMGLGGWMHCGFMSREIFEAMGCTLVTPAAAPALANPLGFDGVFHAYCPPFFPEMDAAVDAALAPLLREEAAPTGASPSARPAAYSITDAEHRGATVEISVEGIACAKAICNYIYETYGRFPRGVDALHLMWLMQVHHIDTEFYDRFFKAGAYGPTHKSHLAHWHAEGAASLDSADG